MIAETIITTKAKILAVFVGGVLVAVADSQFPAQSIEDWTAKGLLALAVGVLYRLLMKSQAESKELRDKHESRLLTVIEANTKSNEKVCELAEEQATYFKTVTRDIVNEKLHAAKQSPPTIP